MTQINDTKIAEVASYFLTKLRGPMHKVKLMLLIYLADRHSLENYDFSITGDSYLNKQNGTSLAHTQLLIDGHVLSTAWNMLIHTEAKFGISTSHEVTAESTKELNPLEVLTLDQMWAEYGSYDLASLVLHAKALPEWKEPAYGHSTPIPLRELLLHLGKTPEQALIIDESLNPEEYELD